MLSPRSLALVVLVGVAAVSAVAVSGNVTAIAGDRATVFVGTGHGLEAGMTGSLWNVAVIEGFLRREEVARFEIREVSAASVEVAVTRWAPDARPQIGLEAVFEAGEPEAPPTPTPSDPLADLVGRGDQLYAAGEYATAAAVYDRAAAVDSTVADVGVKQILAVLRAALERGDDGPVFESAVRAFGIVQSMDLAPELAAEVGVIEELLEAREQAARATPTPTSTPTPQATPTMTPTPAPIREGDVVQPGPGVELPELVSRGDLIFPSRAPSTVEEAEVSLRALVDTRGRVERIRVDSVSVPDAGFEDAAAASLSRWRFRPARADGVKVRMWVPIRLRFVRGGT